MAHTEWVFDVCDGSGNTLTALTRAAGQSVTHTRNGVPESVFSLSHNDDECATILEALAAGAGGGVPTLKGYREGRDGTKTLRFNGYLAAISEESGTDNSTATFTFKGPFGRYLGDGSNRGVFINSAGIAYTGVDAGQIAQAVVNGFEAVGESPGNLTIGPGHSETTKDRDRTYQPFTNVGELIVNLTNVLDGFDFEVGPNINPGAATPTFMLDVYAKQGSNRPAVKFEYGPSTLANCSAAHRQTTPPINDVIVAGANGLWQEATDVASISKYGVWLVVVQVPDVSEAQTLLDKAYALLRPNPIKALDFTPEPRLAPSPWDDYWIGDTVYFYANRGALVEGPVGVRVNQITVAIDPDTGLEAATIPDPVSADEERVIRAGLQTEVVE